LIANISAQPGTQDWCNLAGPARSATLRLENAARPLPEICVQVPTPIVPALQGHGNMARNPRWPLASLLRWLVGAQRGRVKQRAARAGTGRMMDTHAIACRMCRCVRLGGTAALCDGRARGLVRGLAWSARYR
jgi:hypothetical protein